MELSLFLRGLAIGLAIAAPVGPIGILCIRRSLAAGFPLGFLTGMGAAAADGVYGAVAAFGLTAVSSFLVAQQGLFRLVGGAVLIALGVQTALKRPSQRAADANAESLVGAFASTFVLTLANPATILSFVAIFAGLGLGEIAGGGTGRSTLGASTVVLGVFLGSAAWWLFLAGTTAALSRQVPAGLLLWINRISGTAIAGFGVAALASFFF